MSLEKRYFGRYYIRKLLGRGGAGEVYLADDLRVSGQVAIKVIWAEENPAVRAESPKQALRPFRREIKALSLLDHPNILRLLSTGEKAVQGRRCAYLVMPYYEEGSLDQWLQRNQLSPLILPEVVAHIMGQLADALQHAHNTGIIHQDVKPSNVLIRSSTSTNHPNVLLADFGIAKFLTAISSASGHSIRGTHQYMAPEIWEGKPVPASDQYALAVMAYELLTGDLPFHGDTPVQLMYQHLRTSPPTPSTSNPHLSKLVDTVLLKALEKEPQDRFPSIAAFVYALQFAVQSDNSSQASEDKSDLESYEGIMDAQEEDEQIIPSFPPMEALSFRRLTPAGKVEWQVNTSRFVQPRPRRLRRSRERSRNPSPIPSRAGGRHQNRFLSLMENPIIGFIVLMIPIVLFASIIFGFGANREGNIPIPFDGGKTFSIPVSGAYEDEFATATAMAHVATATAIHPNPYPPYHGTLVLNDPLRDNSRSHGWQTSPSTSGNGCVFFGGVYHVTTAKGGSQKCIETASIFSDFAYEVQMTILKGNAGGMYFRVDHTGGYALLLNLDGRYQLDEIVNGVQITLTRGMALAWKTGLNQPNIIAVVAHGRDIDVYINYHYVAHANASNHTTGQVGLIADSSGTDVSTDVAYSDAEVWSF